MILLDTARRPQHIELVALLFSSQTVLALCQWASLILLTRKINTFFFLQYPASLGEKHAPYWRQTQFYLYKVRNGSLEKSDSQLS